MHRLRVFTDEDGSGGALVGVALPELAPATADRGTRASALGCAVVFVDDVTDGRLEIHDRDGRAMRFAAHALVGAGWLLARRTGRDIVSLCPPAGPLCSWRASGSVQWISVDARCGPEVTLLQYAAPQDVDDLRSAPFGVDVAYCWAWEDQLRQSVRARCFAPGRGVEEDEATGEAAVRLAGALGRAVAITQGRRSVLYAKPRGAGRVALGGRVVPDDRQPDGRRARRVADHGRSRGPSPQGLT